MKLRLLSSSAVLCLSLLLFGSHAGVAAQEGGPPEPKWLQQMHAKGWRKVQEGVLQRDTGGGRFETFSYGAEGLRWVVQGYERQLRFFEGRYSEWPTPELAKAIDQLRGEIDRVNGEISVAPPAESFDGETLAACTVFEQSMQASAGPQETPQGVKAEASASFRSDCFVADTYAVAHAEATDASGTHNIFTQEDPESGSSISSHASASMAGVTNCYSWAQASVSYEGSVYLTPLIENYSCPVDIEAVINGPASVTTDYYTNPCADATWTASATGGNGGYTYKWYVDGVLRSSTDSTLTEQFCNRNTPATVEVVAMDSAGWSGSAVFTTNFNYIGPVTVSFSGPTSVTTDSYINSGCADVTWTASTTGGHPGYTYTWYFDADPPVQGNPFNKRICTTNKSVTLKVVATDSDGHTADEIKTITINHIPAVIASISGRTSVTTDYYTSACADVTWTASATGGHPGYTYSWYIGTDPTLQGTGSTFTKSYCNTSQSVTVKVVTNDSDGHTDSDTFTTTISYKAAIVAKITGPTSVSSSTSCTTVSWTASASGTGHSGFSYKWYIGTTLQTTGTSFSKQFCSSGGSSQSVTVKVTATASDGHQDSDSHTTSISFTPPPSPTASISGPAAVKLTSSTECKSITWTASATGGTPGYTYSWYIGTSTTVQGTATTLTKTYCGPQTINVKVVVRDSAAQTDQATFTTTITVTPPLTASISGPSEETVYGTQCVTITWTANVSGGTPAYSYSWTIGTSTTVLSTTSSLSKTVCTAQTLNVKLAVRDSSSPIQTANATFTTTVYKEPATTCFVAQCP